MTVPSSCWTVESSVRTAAANAELRLYRFPEPSEVLEDEDRPILSLNLPRRGGDDGRGRFGASDAPDARLGALIFRPGGIPLRAHGRGGRSRIFVCEFEPDHFRRVSGLDFWTGERLRRCLDLRSASITAAMRRLLRETVSQGFGSAIMIESLAAQIAIDLARTLGADGEPRKARRALADWQLKRIREMLFEAEGEWPSLAQLAEACHIHRCHLSRCFPGTTGHSLSSYSAAIRMQRAKALLARGDASVGDVASRLGFASAASFATAFRRDAGLQPRDYARRARQPAAG